MKKILLWTMLLSCVPNIYAQKIQSITKVTDIILPTYKSVSLEDGVSKSIGCRDTINYGIIKQSAIAPDSNFYYYPFYKQFNEAASQTFLLSSTPLTIHGVQFISKMNSSSLSLSCVVKVDICNVDADNKPSTVIGTANVTVSGTTGFIYTANFSTPIVVSNNYAVVLTPNSTNAIIDFIINTPWLNESYDEDFCHLKSTYADNNSNGLFVKPEIYTELDGGPYDFDLCVAPIVSYTITSSVSASETEICLGEPVTFSGLSEPASVIGNRMYNLHVLRKHFNIAASDSTFIWDKNAPNLNLSFDKNPTYTYTSSGAYQTKFYTLGGLSNNCTDITNGPVINVSPSPVANITSSANSLCENGSSLTLSATPVNGTFSGDGVSTNQFNPSLAGVGTHTITYSVTVNNCTGSATQTIQVDALPTIQFSPINALCINESPVSLTATPIGGVYSGDGLTGSSFNPMTAGNGTHPITYTFTALSCTASQIQNIIVSPCLGIDNLDTQSIQVYPNPTSQKLNIETTSSTSFLLISTDGKIVIPSQLLNSGINTIDVSSFARGVYFMHFGNESGNRIEKINIQ